MSKEKIPPMPSEPFARGVWCYQYGHLLPKRHRPLGFQGHYCPRCECPLPKIDLWISVKDELPEENDLVLVYEASACRLDLGIHQAGAWRTLHRGEQCFVTHWMPLPKPPEEKAK